MGSHYIQVGKLKVDSALLDIVCPAAGYGETPPDPAIYCPANGYTQPTAVWTPPFGTVAPTSGQIILLYDDGGYGMTSVYAVTSSGLVKFEVLGENGSVLFTTTFTSGNTYTYTFATQGAGNYYQVRLSPNTAGQNITTFTLSAPTGYSDKNQNLIQAEFYTPALVSLNQAFQGNSYLKKVVFNGAMNSFTTLTSAFQKCSVESITWPTSMTALQLCSSAFREAIKIRELNWSGFTLNSLQNLSYFAYQSSLASVKFPASLAAVTNMSYFAYRNYFIKTLQMPTANMAALTDLSYAFQYCEIEELLFPEMSAVTNISNFCQYMPFIRKITMAGSMNSLTTSHAYAFAYCPLLEELILPENMNGVNSIADWCSTDPKLRKVGNPASMTSSTSFYGIFLGNYVIEEYTRMFTGVHPTTSLNFNMNCHKLKSFNQPNLKVQSISIGYSSTIKAPLTAVEINWASSAYGSGTVIAIYAQLDATEINRIFTALPTVTSKTINVVNNPGYATCTKTIATAKGWTVT